MISMNLKRLRKEHQYTQENVAEKINVSRQSIAKWENGESTPDIDTLINLSKLSLITSALNFMKSTS